MKNHLTTANLMMTMMTIQLRQKRNYQLRYFMKTIYIMKKNTILIQRVHFNHLTNLILIKFIFFDILIEQEEEQEETHSPKHVYKKMCDNLKVIPCRYYLAHIDKQKLTMKYHQFSEDELRAISKPLWVYNYIK